MKTTIELPDDLAARAKELAARRGISLRTVIEEGVRKVIRTDRNQPEFKFPDARVTGKGLQQEFQHKSWLDVQAAAYEGRGG